MNLRNHALPKKMDVDKAPLGLRIAFVYSRMPFPMMRGDQLTVAHLLSFLAARGHDVDFFTTDADGDANDAQKAWLDDACRSVQIYKHSVVARVFATLKGLLRGLPMQVGMFTVPELTRDIRKGIENGRFDVVYVYYLRSAEVISKRMSSVKPGSNGGRNVTTFLAMQLSQTLNTKRIYDNERGLKKLLYWIEFVLLRRYEARVWQRFTRTVLIGPRDVEAIKDECRQQQVREIDNWVYGAHGTDVGKFIPAQASEVVPGRVVFSGSMLYTPNVQAILWFVEKCWPSIRSQVPGAELIVQGRDPVQDVRKLHGKDGVVVTGTVPDVGTMIRSASVCINPMLAAGGMQNKLIEYLASAKAVVATTVANEGIGATPGEHFLLADSAADFSRGVLTLLADGVKREELGRAARAFTMKNWTWEAHFMELERSFYSSVHDAGLDSQRAGRMVSSEHQFNVE